jgi:hypothetical protein
MTSYWCKTKSLWLEYPEDHEVSEDIGPKLLFLLGIDWYTYNERPRYVPKYLKEDTNNKKDYNKVLKVIFYLTYWQFHASFKIGKMPYTTQAEYLHWRKHDVKRNS